jgi:hypothetical protein
VAVAHGRADKLAEAATGLAKRSNEAPSAGAAPGRAGNCVQPAGQALPENFAAPSCEGFEWRWQLIPLAQQSGAAQDSFPAQANP